MSALWRKVAGDARQNGRAIALIALILCICTAGIVAALDAQAILKREIAASYRSAASPDIALWFDRLDEATRADVAAHEDVADVEPRRVVFTRIAAGDGSWLPLRLTILRDIDTQAVARLHRHGGATSSANGLWLEQSSEGLVRGGQGQPLRVRTPTGSIATPSLAGYVHDTAVAPSTQERLVYGYATREVAMGLGQNPEPDQLWVRMKAHGDTGNAAALADALRDQLKAHGRTVLRIDVLPNAHPHARLMDAMLKVLGVTSVIAFICGVSLAGYLVSAWMRREVRLVGILKAIGARSHQVALQYLLLVAPLVLGVVVIALPLGAVAGLALVRYNAHSLNIDVADWSVATSLRIEEIAFTLLVALASMAWPIVRASRMSVREAIQDAGIASPITAGSRLARAVTVPGELRWTFALRNAMRRPFRLALVVLALTAGGALLLTTHSNYESLMAVIDESLATQGHDIEAILLRPVTAATLEGIARDVPGMARAEAWRRASVNVAGQDAEPTMAHVKRLALVGYPPDTQLFRLPVREGRLPSRGARDEVLMTRTVREAHPDVGLGSEIPLQFRERRATVRVVGIVEEIGIPALYAPFSAFDAVTVLGDASTSLRVKVKDGALQSSPGALDQALLEAHVPPVQLLTRAMFRDALDEHFKVVGDVLRMVALAAALGGAIVLGAGTCFNVLERRREIGVLRALGAAPRAIGAMLVAEGATIAVVGAVLAIALSIVLTLALNAAAARTLLHVAVPLRFSLEGFAILLAGSVVIIGAVWATVALSLRRTVQETLSYEG